MGSFEEFLGVVSISEARMDSDGESIEIQRLTLLIILSYREPNYSNMHDEF